MTMPARLKGNLPGVRQVRGGRNHHFAGQRQDRAFDGHEQCDEPVAAGLQRGQIPGDERIEQLP